MPRGEKRKERDPYSTSHERLSVYPSYKSSGVESKGPRIIEGASIRVRVTGVDDEGRPTGFYKGHEVAIEAGGADVEPGETVSVKVTRVSGRKVYGRLQGGEV